MADDPSAGRPMWFAILAIVLTVSPPLTAAVHAWVSKNRELQILQAEKARQLELAYTEQRFKTQSWFLENAVDPKKTPELRQQVLRFIAATPNDPQLKAWAVEELKALNEFRNMLAASEKKVQEVLRKLRETEKQLASERSPRTARLKALRDLRQRIEANQISHDEVVAEMNRIHGIRDSSASLPRNP